MKSLPAFALLSITVIWGWTFVLVKQGMTEVGPLSFLAARFGIAFLVLSILLHRTFREIDRLSLTRGAVVGIALFLGYLFQTWGLVYTTATKSGLLTGLSVVIVPIISSLALRKRIRASAWLGALLAAGGLFLLVVGRGQIGALNKGDVLSLACAVSFATHIILVDRFVRHTDYRQLLLVQVGVVGLLSLIGTLSIERTVPAISGMLVEAILVTGILATALALYVLNRFQSSSSASYTAIILTMEPVFAGLFGFLLLGETLGLWQWVGSGMILAGIAFPTIWGKPT
ncbi:DMT family transporter [Candidatus Bipolaricaulota bacterium]|nr:DMT family transporter [Candidatus Bipolaricaulota bacterium]HHR84833.1 DMT family transporter [Candidatus Acetothermia bacterium]